MSDGDAFPSIHSRLSRKGPVFRGSEALLLDVMRKKSLFPSFITSANPFSGHNGLLCFTVGLE
ncbi:hypothetical protein STEG23_008915, partial [Scotinomys teguina]